MREELKELLTESPSKRNFVILEYMLNCSAKVYFKKFEEYIKSRKSERVGETIEQAQNNKTRETKCFIWCCSI